MKKDTGQHITLWMEKGKYRSVISLHAPHDRASYRSIRNVTPSRVAWLNDLACNIHDYHVSVSLTPTGFVVSIWRK